MIEFIDGYKAVKVELLNGSHSAEIRLTVLDNNNNLIKCPTIDGQGYDTIEAFNKCISAIIDDSTYSIHNTEYVGWKYTMKH